MKKIIIACSALASISCLLFSMPYTIDPTHRNPHKDTITKDIVLDFQIEIISLLHVKRFLGDTILIRGPIAVEPNRKVREESLIKVDSITGEQKLISSIVTEPLRSFFVTNTDKYVSMEFNVNEREPAFIQSYISENKKLGYGFKEEPLLSKNGEGYLFDDYVKEKDTLINGASCIIVRSDKEVVDSTMTEGIVDTLQTIRIVIKPELKGFCLPYISKKICDVFGGPIVRMDLVFRRGFTIRFSYDYHHGFDTRQEQRFNQYHKAYMANIQQLDSLKRNVVD